MRTTAAVAVLLVAVSTHVSGTSELGPCDPLTPELCMFPFPNNFWLRGSPARTNFSDSTFPLDDKKQPIRVEYGGWNHRDGFSPMGPIATYFADATLDNCARLWNVGFSTTPGSSWVLLDTVTGKAVPHWVELDWYSPLEDERAFLLWPSSGLVPGRRYIVAARKLTTTSGNPVTVSDAFKALRDNSTSTDPNVNLRRSLFEEIFSHLTNAGWDRASLQVAWDFTVASTSQTTGSMVFMRDDALARIPSSGFEYKISKVTANVSSDIAYEIEGTFMSPWYLNTPGLIPPVTSRLSRNATTGMPAFQSMQPIAFLVRVPRILTTPGHMAGFPLQFGHGLFGDKSEIRSGYLGAEANKYGYFVFAVDWIGLSQYDEVSVGLMMDKDLSNFGMIPDRCHQGMLNALMAMHFVTETLVNDKSVMFHGSPAFDPKKPRYMGSSQGGILGLVYMSLSTQVTLGCIDVGGGPYALLLPRSVDFQDLGILIKARYSSPLSRAALFQLFGELWADLEPSGYTSHISGPDLLPNTPDHRIILHYGLGDAQVSWLGMKMVARTAGAVMFKSNVVEGNTTLFGFPFVEDSVNVTTGNVVQGFDFGAPHVPFTNTPPNSTTDTHEFPRRTPSSQAQIHTFFETGVVHNYCNGPCKQPPPSLDL